MNENNENNENSDSAFEAALLRIPGIRERLELEQSRTLPPIPVRDPLFHAVLPGDFPVWTPPVLLEICGPHGSGRTYLGLRAGLDILQGKSRESLLVWIHPAAAPPTKIDFLGALPFHNRILEISLSDIPALSRMQTRLSHPDSGIACLFLDDIDRHESPDAMLPLTALAEQAGNLSLIWSVLSAPDEFGEFRGYPGLSQNLAAIQMGILPARIPSGNPNLLRLLRHPDGIWGTEAGFGTPDPG